MRKVLFSVAYVQNESSAQGTASQLLQREMTRSIATSGTQKLKVATEKEQKDLMA